MRRYIFIAYISLCLLFAATTAKASHIYGADFFYEYVAADTYRVSLVFYGDCGGGSFPSFTSATPTIILNRHGVQYTSFNLALTGPGVEVTPVCPGQQHMTTCKNPSNPIPGVMRFTYSKLIRIPDTSSAWIFQFNGQLNSSLAGRSNSMTNIIVGSSGSLVTFEALLNNMAGPNSSPKFSTIPTPFYCINIAQQYNQGAIDTDNDSLLYALVPGLDYQTGGTASYIPPFTPTAPLATAAGTFSFDSSSGQMAFTPNTVQQSLVVNKVTEYRNGIVVGTSIREMTFIVLNNCNNSVTAAMIDSSAGAALSGGRRAGLTVFTTCVTPDSIRFDIVPQIVSTDTITATVQGLPPGATALISNNGTPKPVVSIVWKHGTLIPGNINFFITYKDNDCPMSSQQTQAFTIRVQQPLELESSVISPTRCIGKAYMEYRLKNSVLPHVFSFMQNGSVVHSLTTTTDVVRDSLAPGQYSVLITSLNSQCSSTFPLVVVDSGIYPHLPVLTPAYYCLNDDPRPMSSVIMPGAVVRWYDASGRLQSGTPTPRTDTAGIFYWYASQLFKVCESLKDSVPVYVTKRPIAAFAGPRSICQKDTAQFNFTGSIGEGPILDYFRDWDGSRFTSGPEEGPWRVHWVSAGVKYIRLQVAENKCASAVVLDSITVLPNPFAGFDARPTVCAGEPLWLSYNTEPFEGQEFEWRFEGADTPSAEGIGPHGPRWSTPGVKRLTLTVDLAGCKDVGVKDITVYPLPAVRIANAPGPVCIGDKIFLKATGGVQYQWKPMDSLRFDMAGNMYAQILKPSVYKVIAFSDQGCIDSTAISYNDVEPCCNFAYPNAFTPNNDGRNDRFRAVTYGNHLQYELSIYNNWGQRVYYGLEAKEGWDGSFNGKPCDAGTYFYYLNAQCFTGRKESHKGTLHLIR